MQAHFIIEWLEIKDAHVELWDSGESENGYWFEFHTRVRRQTCVKCKHRTKRVHSYRSQNVQGSRMNGKAVTLVVKKRRYRCGSCGHTFYERFSFVDRYQRHTVSVAQNALMLCSEMSFTQAARWSGLHPNRLLRMFDQREMPVQKVLPRAIALDEFKGDAGDQKFQTILVDVEKREIIDVLPERRVETIETYFRGCDTSHVQIVVMDLAKAFKEAVRRQLGSPLIIADRFHYMRQVYWAFDQVRREVQNEQYKSQRIRMKRNKKLLWKSPTKLDEQGKERVEELLKVSPRLREAYELKNELDRWFKTSTKENAKERLEAWFRGVMESGNEAFKKSRSYLHPLENGDPAVVYVSV